MLCDMKLAVSSSWDRSFSIVTSRGGEWSDALQIYITFNRSTFKQNPNTEKTFCALLFSTDSEYVLKNMIHEEPQVEITAGEYRRFG